MRLVLLGVRRLTRKWTGGKVLLCLYNNRHKSLNEATIGMIEVDMNNNIKIAYLTPDIILAIRYLEKHIRILV